MPLPSHADLEVGKLVRALRDKTQCYKILFVRSLIGALCAEDTLHVSCRDLVIGMVEAAWWPILRYRLQIGVKDRLSAAVVTVAEKAADDTVLERRARISDMLGDQRDHGFLHYVPQRILRSWYPERLTDQMVDEHIATTSLARRDELGMPYGQDPEGLSMHPRWQRYLRRNAGPVKAWLDLLWLDWLQRLNPIAPVTLAKLSPPWQRRSLSSRTAIFERLVAGARDSDARWRCIYTQVPLELPLTSIDHFILWSFVGHDEIWNLVPVNGAAVNSSKEDSMPDARFIASMSAFHRGIVSALDRTMRVHAPLVQSYCNGLRIDPDDLWKDGEIESAYPRIMKPLMMTAETMGFDTGWYPGCRG